MPVQFEERDRPGRSSHPRTRRLQISSDLPFRTCCGRDGRAPSFPRREIPVPVRTSQTWLRRFNYAFAFAVLVQLPVRACFLLPLSARFKKLSTAASFGRSRRGEFEFVLLFHSFSFGI